MTRSLLFLLLTTICWADAVIDRTSVVKTTFDGRTETVPRRERVSIAKGNVRIEDLDLAEVWIVRADKGVLWYVDLRAGEVAEVPFDLIRERRDDLVSQLKECAARVTDKDLNAKYVEMLAQLGGGEAAAPEVALPGEKSDVAGRACERVTVKCGKLPVLDAMAARGCAWAADYWGAFAKILALPPGVPEALAKDGLFVMRGKVRMSFLLARVERTDEVTKVEEKAVDAGAFELPAGLKKIELPGFEAERGPKEAPKGGVEEDHPK